MKKPTKTKTTTVKAKPASNTPNRQTPEQALAEAMKRLKI
jgi:hypothetical protein